MATPLGRRETREILARHGLKPKTALGQHFLVDPNTIMRVVELAGVQPGEQVLEVGPGLGTLTIALQSVGARVIAVEHDRGLQPALEEVLLGRDRITIVWGDAMTVDLRALLRGLPTKLVANLPYNISVPLLMHVLEEIPQIDECTVMVQREVADRVVAKPGTDPYGAVSAKIAYLADAAVVFKVSRRVFMPEPAVESVVLSIRRRDKPPVAGIKDRIFGVIDAGFAQRRKTIRAALRNAGLDPSRIEEALEIAGITGETRAERLGLEQFAAIASVLRVPRR
ncbi:MAG TPA: 16S rRNA (adenine(1518)-N(6)/adenine(1519)-N(6))-dimethyltransferase RsmA [Actinomycetota bacterium]